jgi:hypothetical protein
MMNYILIAIVAILTAAPMWRIVAAFLFLFAILALQITINIG